MKRICILALILVILCGCKLTDWFKKKEEEKTNITTTYNVTVPVTTSPAHKGTLIKYIRTNGIAEVKQKADVVAEVTGIIESISYEENQYVTKDEIVLTIDKERILLDIQQAELTLEKAKAEYNAWKKVGENSDDDQLKIQTGLTDAEIQLQKLNLDLDKSIITMPFNGVITNLHISEGEQVSPGKELFSVFNLDEFLIRVKILESEISRIQKGTRAIICFPAIDEIVYEGKVESISPTINRETRTCEILIKLKNDAYIKDGMFAEVKIAAEKYEDRIMVYKDALLIRDGKKLIFAVEEKKAKWQYVTTGEQNEKFIEIIEGVTPDQDIVIDGNFSLSHDASVEVEKKISFEEINEQF
ncbi:MAG: efflux RND transporter periplasmic adaptor subunit [Candidatus Cloacimonetes bacterium]|nr:efflux RND transporter periplasmic adaptor subunit [Candidatus Cloacimonadota bacterium]